MSQKDLIGSESAASDADSSSNSTDGYRDPFESSIPEFLHEKLYQLSSTIKDTGKYLKNIDCAIIDGHSISLKQTPIGYASKQRTVEQNSDIPTVCTVCEHQLTATQCEHKSSALPMVTEIEEAEKKYNRLKSKAKNIIHSWKQKHKQAEHQIEQQYAMIENLQQFNEANEKSLHELTQQILSSQSQTDQIQELKTAMAGIIEQHETLMATTDQLKASLQMEQKNSNDLSTENKLHKAQLCDYKEIEKNLAEENKRLQQTIDRLQQKEVSCNQQLIQLNSQQKENLRSMETVQSKMQECQKQKDDIQSQYKNFVLDISRQLNTAICCMHTNSSNHLQAGSSAANNKNADLRICLAEFHSNFSWLLQEVQMLSVHKCCCCSPSKHCVHSTLHHHHSNSSNQNHNLHDE